MRLISEIILISLLEAITPKPKRNKNKINPQLSNRNKNKTSQVCKNRNSLSLEPKKVRLKSIRRKNKKKNNKL